MAGIRTWVEAHRSGTKIAVLGTAVLLLGVAAILAVRLFSGEIPTADPGSPSGSAQPSTRPSASAIPSASATEQPAPTESPPAVAFGGPIAAIVLVNDLNVRDEPGTGNSVASLDAETIVEVADGPESIDGTDWYRIVQYPGIDGWVSGGPTADPFLDLRYAVASNVPARVDGVAGGAAGYVAWGSSPRVSSENQAHFIAASSDGTSWQLGSMPDAVAVTRNVVVDHGPSGWILAAGSGDNATTAGMWRSDDGLSWDPIDPPSATEGRVPVQIVGFDSGYAFTLRGSDGSPAVLLTSPDGTSWREVDVPVSDISVIDLGAGLLAWGDLGEPHPLIRYSPDGSTWIDPAQNGARDEIIGTAVKVGKLGDGLVAISNDSADSSAIRVWRATPSAGGFDWVRQPSAEAQLAGTAISVLVEVPGGALAIGGSFDDGRLQPWLTRDGFDWEEADVSAIGSGGGIGPMAMGPAGLAAVGYDITAAGPNPFFVRSPDGAGWQRETDSVLGLVESAGVGTCPEPPATMIGWLAVPGAVGAECFGDDSITFRAWLTAGGGCGGATAGRFEPGWLASPFAILAIVLTPYEAESGSCGSAAKIPDLELPQIRQWVDVTGHWADQAAGDCRGIPLRNQPMGPSGFARGPSALTFACRTTFVVTEMAPAPAPAP